MNNQHQNKNKEIFEISEELKMKIFDRFLITQIMCTLVGSLSNTFIHGFSPVPSALFVSSVTLLSVLLLLVLYLA